jgi:hypothetical protein
MRKPGLVAFGALLVVVGAVWFGQGIGWIGGSGMTGETLWAVVGPILAVVGVGLVALGVRGGRRSVAEGKNTEV